MLLDFFLPRKCVHCDEPCGKDSKTDEQLKNYLCPICFRRLELLFPPNEDDLTSKRSLLSKYGEVQIIAPFPFMREDLTQDMIHYFKYNDMPKLAAYIGEYITQSIDISDYNYLIPIPLHSTRFAERGYNQSEMLSKGIAKRTKVAIAPNAWFKRIKQTPSQIGLSPDEREENMRGAFALTKKGKDNLREKRMLVVDDVMTTGATLASAVEILLEVQPTKIGVLAFATVVDPY